MALSMILALAWMLITYILMHLIHYASMIFKQDSYHYYACYHVLIKFSHASCFITLKPKLVLNCL